MDKVAIVTDSAACLPQELVDRYAIQVVPISLIFEDKVYRDGVDITPTEVYEMLPRVKKLPTTSAPSPGEFLQAYQELSRKSASILCITVSSKLSMVFDSARQARELAKEEFPETTIEVLDSATAAGAEGFVVLAAARAAAEGNSLAQVTEVARSLMPRVNLIVLMDTLYYLAKGGRIPKAAAWAGSILSIKPILHVSGGELELLERARTNPRAVKRLLAIMKERTGVNPVSVNLHHTNIPAEAERLKAEILAQFNCAELYVTDFTPVMGVHTGPGLLGLAFWSE